MTPLTTIFTKQRAFFSPMPWTKKNGRIPYLIDPPRPRQLQRRRQTPNGLNGKQRASRPYVLPKRLGSPSFPSASENPLGDTWRPGQSCQKAWQLLHPPLRPLLLLLRRRLQQPLLVRQRQLQPLPCRRNNQQWPRRLHLLLLRLLRRLQCRPGRLPCLRLLPRRLDLLLLRLGPRQRGTTRWWRV